MNHCWSTGRVLFNFQSWIRGFDGDQKYGRITVLLSLGLTVELVKKAQLISTKDEIKFLYKKKEKPNQELDKIHLETAQERESRWYIVQNCIQDALNRGIEKKYKVMDDKIPYFSIDNAHVMYNAHPKLFDIPFDV
jgi:hypothetical protein